MKKVIFKSKKRMLTFATATVLIAGYIWMAIFPNLFVRRELNQYKDRACMIVAHRGGAGLAPENTLECIQKGMDAGADMIEIDVHLTKDNQLIVCHDKSVNRTTNGKGLIRKMNLAEVKKLRIVDKDGQLTDQSLPTLEEVLSLVNGKAKLLIEIKNPGNIYEGIEQILMQVLKSYDTPDWIAVQSFDDSTLEEIHRIDKNLRLEKLILFKFPGLSLIFDGNFGSFNREKYNHISSFNFYYLALPEKLIDKIHSWGKEVKIWTLSRPDKTPDLPVDGIICDRPDLFRTKH